MSHSLNRVLAIVALVLTGCAALPDRLEGPNYSAEGTPFIATQ